MKSVIKEIFIIILLIIVIVLILGILFYEYNPTKKKIPTQVADYQLPQEMQEELEETLEETKTQNIVKTYRIDATDLKIYERTNDYNKGKANPFAPGRTESSTGTQPGSSGSSGNSSGSTNSSSGNSSGGGSGGSILPNAPAK